MVAAKDVNYSSLINRKVTVLACLIGMLELLVAVFTIICAFIMLGAFCENFDYCSHTSTGLGFWMGFPLLIPGILGLVVLGTRHGIAVKIYVAMNVIVLILAIAHIFIVNRDYDDTWNSQKSMYDNNQCSILGSRHCVCSGTTYGYPCELIEFGYELNWILFGTSIATIVFTLIGAVTGIVGIVMTYRSPREK